MNYINVNEYVKQLYMCYRYLKCLLLKIVYEVYFRSIMKLSPFYVYKVYAYPFDEIQKREDITESYYNGYGNKCTPSANYPRIEYRCLWKGNKYKLTSVRQVSKDENKDVMIPMLLPKTCNKSDPSLSTFTRKRIDKFVVNACLTGENKQLDVTKSLLKFAGPNHDFFNQPIIVKWILKNPNKILEYSVLEIFYSNGELNRYTMSETINI